MAALDHHPACCASKSRAASPVSSSVSSSFCHTYPARRLPASQPRTLNRNSLSRCQARPRSSPPSYVWTCLEPPVSKSYLEAVPGYLLHAASHTSESDSPRYMHPLSLLPLPCPALIRPVQHHLAGALSTRSRLRLGLDTEQLTLKGPKPRWPPV